MWRGIMDKNTKETAEKQPALEQFKHELAQKEALLADYTDHLKRLQAEFENYCKRVEKERKDVVGAASEKLVVKLLLVVDDFERSKRHCRYGQRPACTMA